ncbi:MAG: site-specific integrase [Clostridiales bacterium]|nr:site-specific integrase [Clostridiales bacterium]
MYLVHVWAAFYKGGYWLYYHKIDEAKITYGTFCNYRNIIYNYILKQWGRGKQMKEIGREECRAVLDTFPSKSLFTSGSHVLKNSFQYALEKNIIDSNQIPAAFILYTAKKEEPAVFMPLLFTITAGTRISESLGIRFSDIDFGKKVLRLKQQIGRSMDNAGLDTDELTLQAVAPKTDNGYRDIPLPDFVLDEVILARKRYDLKKQCMPGFKDYGYVCCQDNGKPHNRSNLYKPYRRVLEASGFDYMVWHGLRHTYASLLADGDISMKVIAKCMGHFDAGFTKEVYVTQQKTVYDGMKEAESFWKEIMPEDNVVLETGMEDELERYIMEVV